MIVRSHLTPRKIQIQFLNLCERWKGTQNVRTNRYDDKTHHTVTAKHLRVVPTYTHAHSHVEGDDLEPTPTTDWQEQHFHLPRRHKLPSHLLPVDTIRIRYSFCLSSREDLRVVLSFLGVCARGCLDSEEKLPVFRVGSIQPRRSHVWDACHVRACMHAWIDPAASSPFFIFFGKNNYCTPAAPGFHFPLTCLVTRVVKPVQGTGQFFFFPPTTI